MFTVIGERINTTLNKVQAAVADRDAEYIKNDVRQQTAGGATYIDVNAGARIDYEEDDMKWLLKVVQEATDLPLCLDSPDPAILEMAYDLVNKKPMINSISLEKERFEPMIEYLKGKACRIVALCMDDSGMPKTAADIVSRAVTLVGKLEAIGFSLDDIFIDPLIQPMSVDITNGTMSMTAIRSIMTELAGVHTTGGLSNISYGLPQRRIINRCFLAMMIANGFDSAIMDPLDKDIMTIVKTGGTEIELETTRAADSQELLPAFIIDLIGLLVLEKTGEIVQQIAEHKAADLGWKVSPFLSPGSIHGWALEEQLNLCSLLPLHEIGIAIRNDAVLTPLKSLACIIGIGAGYTSSTVGTTCQVCSKKENCHLKHSD